MRPKEQPLTQSAMMHVRPTSARVPVEVRASGRGRGRVKVRARARVRVREG